MKILEKDLKRGYIKLQVETADDLWVLYSVIREGDVVYAKTTREVKPYEGSEGRRVPMILGIRVRGIEFQQFTDKLRITGLVIDGPEEYGVRGKHHTVAVGVGDVVTVFKEQWRDFEVRYIERFSLRRTRILIVCVDYEEACISILTEQGVKQLWEYRADMPTKAYVADYDSILRDFLLSVESAVVDLATRESVDAVIIAGPGEVKTLLRRRVLDKLDKPTYLDTTTTGGCQGIREVLERDVVKQVVRDSTLVKAQGLLLEFKTLLVRDHDMVAYGVHDVYNATLVGAVSKVLVVDALLKVADDEVRRMVYEALDNAMRRGAEIVVVPGKSDVGVEVEGFGGIIAILRFKLQKFGEYAP